MSVSFDSSKYCISRAKHHLTDLEGQIDQFFSTNPYTHVVDYDPNTRENVHKIKLTKPMPVSLSGIMFDGVNNLRSALDQAIFALGRGEFRAFPFADNSINFEKAVKGRCKDLPDEIADLVRTFKAYKGGNDLLWALNQLCNSNKHAIITPVAIARGDTTLSIIEFRGPGSLSRPVWDRAKNEMEIARLEHGGTFHMNLQVDGFIAIRDVEIVDGEPAPALLNEFIRIVEGIVMAIEAEARRIGL
jgi:hypothetical protein